MHEDLIFSAYSQAARGHNKHEQLRIVSYDLDLNKKHWFANNISYPIYVFYSDIDVCNNRVYLKVCTKNRANRNSQIVYVLDMNLNKVETFKMTEPADLHDIKIRSDYITYYSTDMSTHTFYIKSLKTKNLLSKIDLNINAFESVNFDTVSSGNLYVYIAKESLINEYDMYGKLVQTIKIKIRKTTNCRMRMTENFKFVIRSLDDRTMYLN